MKIRSIHFLLLFAFVSCSGDVNYKDIASHPNYYDSLHYASYLNKIKSISLTDSFKNNFVKSISSSHFDSVMNNNSYILDGIQNINVFNELEKSYELGKPLLIYFTAIGGQNCRRFENNILEDKDVKTFLNEKFVFIPLNVDVKQKLPENYWLKNPFINKHTRGLKPLGSIGGINSFFQVAIDQSGSQPVTVALDINQKLGSIGYTNSKDEFLSFMNQVIETYRK